MQELSFRFTIEETNMVLEALGNLPFVKVHTLIGKIQQQATQQINGTEPPTTADEETLSAIPVAD
jgi:hypothetical protein